MLQNIHISSYIVCQKKVPSMITTVSILHQIINTINTALHIIECWLKKCLVRVVTGFNNCCIKNNEICLLTFSVLSPVQFISSVDPQLLVVLYKYLGLPRILWKPSYENQFIRLCKILVLYSNFQRATSSIGWAVIYPSVIRAAQRTEAETTKWKCHTSCCL